VDPRAFLDELTADPEVAPSLVGVRELSAREPLTEPFPGDLPELLVQRLALLGIEGLYPHQARGAAGGAQPDHGDRNRER
jgi:hypothetical protein